MVWPSIAAKSTVKNRASDDQGLADAPLRVGRPRNLHISNPRARKAVEWLKKHPSSRHPLRDVAVYLNCSEQTICRDFKQTLGRSPQVMHAQFKFSSAKSLLIADQRSLSDIATTCGFGTSSAFCLAFRRKFGTSPKTWRTQAL